MQTAREKAKKKCRAAFVANEWNDPFIALELAADAASDVWEPLLRKYGHHEPKCPRGMFSESKCACGLSEALGNDDS